MFQFGLYDSESVVTPPPGSIKKRPTSAVKQRSSDAARARPKSSGKRILIRAILA